MTPAKMPELTTILGFTAQRQGVLLSLLPALITESGLALYANVGGTWLGLAVFPRL